MSKLRDGGPNHVPVDTGQVIVVDPCYLFNHPDWMKIVNTKTHEAMHKAIFSKLKKKLALCIACERCFRTQLRQESRSSVREDLSRLFGLPCVILSILAEREWCWHLSS